MTAWRKSSNGRAAGSWCARFAPYLEEEGAEIFEDAEALADEGESISAEEVIAEMREIIEAGERRRAKDR